MDIACTGLLAGELHMGQPVVALGMACVTVIAVALVCAYLEVARSFR